MESVAVESETFKWLDDVGLVVADVPWEAFPAALRDTSGESFDVQGPVTDVTAWIKDLNARVSQLGGWRTWSLLAGELDGRSYVTGDTIMVPSHADRIVALAAHTGGLVLGYTFQDISATGEVVAAQGSSLLRYALVSNWGEHDEGTPLPGETADSPAWAPYGFRDVLSTLGFDVDGWLHHGAKSDVLWTALDPEEQPEAHARLYFGPLRQRVDWIERAALEEM